MDKSVARTFRSHMMDDLERAAGGFIQAEGIMKRALGRLWQVMSEDPDLKNFAPNMRSTAVNGTAPALSGGHVEDEALLQLKQEQEDEEMTGGSDIDEEERERRRRLARAPDLTPASHKIFIMERPLPHVSRSVPGSQLQPHVNGVNGHADLAPSVGSASGHDRGREEERDGEGSERSFVPVEAQLESLEKSLAALRELADDGREYVERLEEIRNGLGEMKAQRTLVWDVVRRKAVKELESAALAAVA
jgi:hypothetical protein